MKTNKIFKIGITYPYTITEVDEDPSRKNDRDVFKDMFEKSFEFRIMAETQRNKYLITYFTFVKPDKKLRDKYAKEIILFKQNYPEHFL